MLKYQFPAVKGCQAGSDYYICMVPLGLLSKIFITDYSDVAPEHRAQRKLNELRVPEIKDYIINNDIIFFIFLPPNPNICQVQEDLF